MSGENKINAEYNIDVEFRDIELKNNRYTWILQNMINTNMRLSSNELYYKRIINHYNHYLSQLIHISC